MGDFSTKKFPAYTDSKASVNIYSATLFQVNQWLVVGVTVTDVRADLRQTTVAVFTALGEAVTTHRATIDLLRQVVQTVVHALVKRLGKLLL